MLLELREIPWGYRFSGGLLPAREYFVPDPSEAFSADLNLEYLFLRQQTVRSASTGLPAISEA